MRRGWLAGVLVLSIHHQAGADPRAAYDAGGQRALAIENNSLEGLAAGATEWAAIPLRGLEPGARLVLAPHGGVVLGVVAGERGVSSITIHGVDGALRGHLGPAKPAQPFRSFFIGGPGRTIATITQILPPDRDAGAWRFNLWSDTGAALGAFVAPAGTKAGFDAAGESLLVIEPSRARVIGRNGVAIVDSIGGTFHKGALSDRGGVVLLGDSVDRRHLSIFIGGVSHPIDAPSAVYGVAVAPDGSAAWVWLASGVVQPVDVTSPTLADPVVVTGASFVTSFTAENNGRALAAFSTRTAGSPADNGGMIARISAHGVLWQMPFSIARPTAFLPAAIAAGTKVIAWGGDRPPLVLEPPPAGVHP